MIHLFNQISIKYGTSIIFLCIHILIYLLYCIYDIFVVLLPMDAILVLNINPLILNSEQNLWLHKDNTIKYLIHPLFYQSYVFIIIFISITVL